MIKSKELSKKFSSSVSSFSHLVSFINECDDIKTLKSFSIPGMYIQKSKRSFHDAYTDFINTSINFVSDSNTLIDEFMKYRSEIMWQDKNLKKVCSNNNIFYTIFLSKILPHSIHTAPKVSKKFSVQSLIY